MWFRWPKKFLDASHRKQDQIRPHEFNDTPKYSRYQKTVPPNFPTLNFPPLLVSSFCQSNSCALLTEIIFSLFRTKFASQLGLERQFNFRALYNLNYLFSLFLKLRVSWISRYSGSDKIQPSQCLGLTGLIFSNFSKQNILPRINPKMWHSCSASATPDFSHLDPGNCITVDGAMQLLEATAEKKTLQLLDLSCMSIVYYDLAKWHAMIFFPVKVKPSRNRRFFIPYF